MNVLGTHLYQSTRWHCCERLRSASVKFFEDSFNVFAHFMMGDLQACLSTPRWVFNSFWPWNSTTPMPHPHYSPDLTSTDWLFFLSLDEESPQREMFCHVEEVKLTTAKAAKGIKIDEFKNCFQWWKKCLNGCITSSLSNYLQNDTLVVSLSILSKEICRLNAVPIKILIIYF